MINLNLLYYLFVKNKGEVMDNKLFFEIGDIVSNKELSQKFKVGNMGGMRKSNSLNCLVLISDKTKGLYEDKWYNDELHYTGMGKEGDQVLDGNQNKTLYYSNTNGVELHLFEVIEPKEYVYRGIVKLSGSPYQEIQIDINNKQRKVWMFPLKPIVELSTLSFDEFQKIQNKKELSIFHMDYTKLEDIAKARLMQRPGTQKISNMVYVRDPYIAAYAKRKAKGICQLCGNFAPFNDSEGKPYLESHHIIWLSKGGADSIDNTVALCPNCHKKMHIVNDEKDIKILQKKII